MTSEQASVVTCYVVLIFLLFSWTMAIIMVSTISILYSVMCKVNHAQIIFPKTSCIGPYFGCKVKLYLLYNVGCVGEPC
jgi:hypothetical protein